jgi:hypothetical protein
MSATVLVADIQGWLREMQQRCATFDAWLENCDPPAPLHLPHVARPRQLFLATRKRAAALWTLPLDDVWLDSYVPRDGEDGDSFAIDEEELNAQFVSFEDGEGEVQTAEADDGDGDGDDDDDDDDDDDEGESGPSRPQTSGSGAEKKSDKGSRPSTAADTTRPSTAAEPMPLEKANLTLHVAGVVLEGARWDADARGLADVDRPDQPFSKLPPLAFEPLADASFSDVDDAPLRQFRPGVYRCPIYATTLRSRQPLFWVYLDSKRPSTPRALLPSEAVTRQERAATHILDQEFWTLRGVAAVLAVPEGASAPADYD